MKDAMENHNAAHGGELVNLIVHGERAGVLKKSSLDLVSITLSDAALCDLELLMNGGFSPLTGFMNHTDYASVLDGMRLKDGTLWPMPVCLDVSEEVAKSLDVGQSVALRDSEGFMLAVMGIESIWPIDKKREAEILFGTLDDSHPGVDQLFHKKGACYVGGTVEGLQLPLHSAFKRYRHTPLELRALFRKFGWRRIVGFHTRHPLHRAQLEMTLRAMAEAKAGLLLHPVAEQPRRNEIDYFTRVHCYLDVAGYYPPNMMLLSLLPLSMRMAGPREALWHAIVRKNYGCTHFIVGAGHADPGTVEDDKLWYSPDGGIEMMNRYANEIGIKVVSFDKMVYWEEEDVFVPAKDAPPGSKTLSMTNDQFQKKLRSSRRIPQWFTFPEVVASIQHAYPPRHRQGFTIFCTGLSGAGKSTIAKVLYARFKEMRTRPVTLLDGDIVRTNLSSELGFSKEHRDINVRRIGFVASEITKNRGIAICAPIAPYAATRRQIRELIESYGGFIEVHVGTALEVCEQRDRKGLYAKARAGLVKGVTGIDDPYEAPENPEVYIDTLDMTPDESAQEVLLYLERAGYTK